MEVQMLQSDAEPEDGNLAQHAAMEVQVVQSSESESESDSASHSEEEEVAVRSRRSALEPLVLREADLRERQENTGDGSPLTAGLRLRTGGSRAPGGRLGRGKAGTLFQRVVATMQEVEDEEEEEAAIEYAQQKALRKFKAPSLQERRRDTQCFWAFMVLLAVITGVAAVTGYLAWIQPRMIHPRELMQATGENGKPLWVCLMGEVYDVSASRHLYGPGGSYSFFAGVDATRAFGTGKFTRRGLVPDPTGLLSTQLLELERWINFYRDHDTYTKVGHLVGHFYRGDGTATSLQAATWQGIERAHKAKAKQDALSQQFPACNSRWAQGEPQKVWCTTTSGGVSRDWVGVPRQMRMSFDGHLACVCVSPSNTRDPRLRRYKGCQPRANRCIVPEEQQQKIP